MEVCQVVDGFEEVRVTRRVQLGQGAYETTVGFIELQVEDQVVLDLQRHRRAVAVSAGADHVRHAQEVHLRVEPEIVEREGNVARGDGYAVGPAQAGPEFEAEMPVVRMDKPSGENVGTGIGRIPCRCAQEVLAQCQCRDIDPRVRIAHEHQVPAELSRPHPFVGRGWEQGYRIQHHGVRRQPVLDGLQLRRRGQERRLPVGRRCLNPGLGFGRRQAGQDQNYGQHGSDELAAGA